MKEVFRLRLDRPLAGSIVAFGGDIKCALALGIESEITVFDPIGDLRSPENQDALAAGVEELIASAGRSATLVCDKHPSYVSHVAALNLAADKGLRLVTVQHHRAHVAAVAAEHGLLDEPVVGLAFDGTGYGDDGVIWGGEFFVGSVRAELQRRASFAPLTLCGGDAAVRSPWRIAAALLIENGVAPGVIRRWREIVGIPHDVFDLFAIALERGINCARSTSLGRWFDCFSALWAVCAEADFEGHAAIELQKAAERHDGPSFLGPATVRWMGDDLAAIQFDEFVETVEYMPSTWGPAHAAAWARQFHASVADAVAIVVARFAELAGARNVCCGGGCFLNSLLCAMLDRRFDTLGLQRLQSKALPPGDQAIALGQVVLCNEILRR